MTDLFFLKMPLMSLPVRSTVIKLTQGNVLLSPGSKLSIEQLKSVDNISDLVAPSLLHCGGIELAATTFQNTKIWAPPNGMKKKPKIKWSAEISADSWPYQEELTSIPIQGMPEINEVVFFHKKSKTMIVCDLCFNLLNAQGISSWIILNIFGTYRKFGISRLYLNYVKNHLAFEASLRQLFSYDFDNLVLGHGENLIGNAKNVLRNAFAYRGFKIS